MVVAGQCGGGGGGKRAVKNVGCIQTFPQFAKSLDTEQISIYR